MLVNHNVEATARLILADFPLELSEVIYELNVNQELQFQFLNVIFDPR